MTMGPVIPSKDFADVTSDDECHSDKPMGLPNRPKCPEGWDGKESVQRAEEVRGEVLRALTEGAEAMDSNNDKECWPWMPDKPPNSTVPPDGCHAHIKRLCRHNDQMHSMWEWEQSRHWQGWESMLRCPGWHDLIEREKGSTLVHGWLSMTADKNNQCNETVLMMYLRKPHECVDRMHTPDWCRAPGGHRGKQKAMGSLEGNLDHKYVVNGKCNGYVPGTIRTRVLSKWRCYIEIEGQEAIWVSRSDQVMSSAIGGTKMLLEVMDAIEMKVVRTAQWAHCTMTWNKLKWMC